MKKKLAIFFIILLGMISSYASAHSIEIANGDGVMIYYLFTHNETELSVSYRGSSPSAYSDDYYGNVEIPEYVNYEGHKYYVTSIGSSAFKGCSGLTSVTIPNSVTSIGSSAFKGCSGLTSVTIPNSVTSIGSSAFKGCSGLTSVTIPNSVNSIGSSAFKGCSGLTSVIIPNSVTNIGSSAFGYCSGLASVTISNSVTDLWATFDGCSGLISVTIPNSVKNIWDGAFSGCSCLTSAIIGSGVNYISSTAFDNTNLKKVIWLTNTPPSGYENVNAIQDYAPNTNYKSIDAIVYPLLNSYFELGGIRYVPVSISEKTCDAIDCIYDSNVKYLNVASTVNFEDISMTVKNIQPYLAYNNYFIENLIVENEGEIPQFAFTGCSNLSTVTIGEDVNKIGHCAFMECSKLQSVVIPDAVSSIASSAFQKCSALTSIKIGDGVTSISSDAFGDCSSLNDIKIGNNVKIIYTDAFRNCKDLSSIIIPPSVTKIYGDVFGDCTSLKNVIIADGETELTLGDYTENANSHRYISPFSDSPLDSVYIGRNISYGLNNYYNSSFSGNKSLRVVKISNKRTEILKNEFSDCRKLQCVIIGENINKIGSGAFNYCTSIKTIVSLIDNPFIIYSNTFSNKIFDNSTLYVPVGTIDKYKATNGWWNFKNIVEGIPSGIKGVHLDNDKDYPIYDINGRRLETPQKGINIINGKKVIMK